MTVETLTVPGLNLWTVPAGITELLVELYGAAGGDGANGGSPGGEGGSVAVKVAVTPGDVYRFAIAGAAPTATSSGTSAYGTNGGYGFGGRGYYGAGAGGAFTGMYDDATGLILFALAAGGGGGAPSITGRPGGAGGPNTGQQGFPQDPYISTPGGGEGGTHTAGGRQGFGDFGYGSNPGSSSHGGDGDTPADGTANRGAPGGGAGYYGGGGGGRGHAASHASGAGGGSNRIATITEILATITNAAGGNAGDGWVRLTYGPEGGWGYNLSFGQRSGL